MVHDARLNKALEHRVLHLKLYHLNKIILNTNSTIEDRHWMVIMGFYLLITFSDSIQGNEGFMVEAYGLINNVPNGKMSGRKLTITW